MKRLTSFTALVFGSSVLLATACGGSSNGDGDGSGGSSGSAGSAGSSTGGSAGSGAGGSGGSGATSGGNLCERVETRLRDCNAISMGRFDCKILEQESCLAECLVDAECGTIQGTLCDDPSTIPTTDPALNCIRECFAADELTCPDGSGTFDSDGICDEIADCADGSDEMGCYQCNDGEALPPDWECDGEIDCTTGEDEMGCDPSLLFDCGDGQMVSKDWVCDLAPDCANAADEEGCALPVCG